MATALLSGWTYLSRPVDLQFGDYLPLWLAMFPPFGWAVYLQQRGLLTVEALSRRARVLFGLVCAAFLGNGIGWFVVVMHAHPSGQPERGSETGQYQVVNHGSVTIVTKKVYESLVSSNSRILLGWPAVFVAVALPVVVNEAVRVRRLHARTPATSHPPAKNRRS
jgi:hypothetical protein